MKDYSVHNTLAKRYVQDKLFQNFVLATKQELTGLAGNHPLIAYLQYYKHLCNKDIHLIDLKSTVNWVECIDITKVSPTYIMDVDLEVSVVNGIFTIKHVYENMNCLQGTKVLCFTVSTRCPGGRNRTLEILNHRLYDLSLNISDFEKEEIGIGLRYVRHLRHTQSKFLRSDLYCYKDSSQMMSGVIVWE